MSDVIPWERSLARPTEETTTFYLSAHLNEARRQVQAFLKDREIGVTVQFLLELGAASHDVGKAHYDWQLYVRHKRTIGPPHAVCGAIFFAYIAYCYLKNTGEWEQHQYLWLLITRDIADHHGLLRGFAKNEDLYINCFNKIDWQGMGNWFYESFPVLQQTGIEMRAESINQWQNEYPLIVEDSIFALYEQQDTEESNDKAMDTLQQWRKITAMLMAADRFAIEEVGDRRFDASDWPKIAKNIKAFCDEGQYHPLAAARSQAQHAVMEQWMQNQEHPFYVLEMPTGYGKTVTALKLATAIASKKKLSKIIYVAPYLSILEQNATAIKHITGYQPLQHHSMALLVEANQKQQLLDENAATDEFSDLDIQAWANEIVCTSFVQLMKAIFPSRAQETLRRIYLHDAIIIIDEPQIINAVIWNLFLKGLASLSRIYNLTLIFCSATMPPFTYGLAKPPVKLTTKARSASNRYQIKLIEPLNADDCAAKLASINEKSSAVIVNTIYDACHVFQLLPEDEKIERYLLHGLMIPLHKKIQLKKISQALEKARQEGAAKNIQVVATQILEAGVDLSFSFMFRALPILPSLTQAAGRVNRHKEKDMGFIETGKFLRNEKDTRFVYPKHLCRLSDDILFQKKLWLEEEMETLTNQFYQEMFKENSYEAILQDIKKAKEGNWEQLSSHEVFNNQENYRLPMFIPFVWHEVQEWLDAGLLSLLQEFDVESPEDMYEIFLDKKYKSSWDYQKRKRFSLLFNQFVLPVPAKKALKLVAKEDFLQNRIPILKDDASYDLARGLFLFEEEVDDSFV